MDVICSTGFGIDASAQTEPANPFIKHTQAFLNYNPARNPFALLSSKCLFTKILMQMYFC